MTAGDTFPGWLRGLLWGLVVAACGLQAYEIRSRGIDPDELEHLHAAYCVSRGDVPYRDFFEHHGPGLYYLLIPLFRLCGPQLSVLWLGRLAMWCCSLGTLWMTGALARRWGGESARLLAMSLLAWTTVFHSKGFELRPDVPAMLLLIVAVSRFVYATGGGSWRRFLYVGLLAGLAMLFTQKAVVPALAMLIAACLARVITREAQTESIGKILARVVVPMAAGIALVWGIASLWFGAAGAAGDFWYSTWYQLWIWPVRSSRWDDLRPTLAGDLTVWLAGVAEIVVLLKNFHAPETWKEQRGAAAVVAALCIASLALVKTAYPQFCLLWMPLLSALAARQILGLAERAAGKRAVLATIVAGEGLVIIQFFLWRRAFSAGAAGALPRLTDLELSNAVMMLVLGLALLGVVAGARREKWGAVLVLLAGLGMGYGGLRNLDAALWTNRDQVAVIEAVNGQVRVDERIFDGFTGYGALRPHVWYYWWINPYSLALITDHELNSRLLTVLEESPPAAILFDQNVKLLPPAVVDWIEAHYEADEPPILWLPRHR